MKCLATGFPSHCLCTISAQLFVGAASDLFLQRIECCRHDIQPDRLDHMTCSYIGILWRIFLSLVAGENIRGDKNRTHLATFLTTFVVPWCYSGLGGGGELSGL